MRRWHRAPYVRMFLWLRLSTYPYCFLSVCCFPSAASWLVYYRLLHATCLVLLASPLLARCVLYYSTPCQGGPLARPRWIPRLWHSPASSRIRASQTDRRLITRGRLRSPCAHRSRGLSQPLDTPLASLGDGPSPPAPDHGRTVRPFDRRPGIDPAPRYPMTERRCLLSPGPHQPGAMSLSPGPHDRDDVRSPWTLSIGAAPVSSPSSAQILTCTAEYRTWEEEDNYDRTDPSPGDPFRPY
jgi:hypothetical protein